MVPARAHWCRRWSTVTTPGCRPRIDDAFRATGLTHLLAVSGTNLTLVVGSLLFARPLGRRPGTGSGRGRVWPGSSGSCCSPAPSRACCEPRSWARSPWSAWARTVAREGVALSGQRCCSCCCSIRGWPSRPGSRCRHSRPPGSCGWLPAGATGWPAGCRGWVAEAVAVPMAAQLACTPLIAGLSGQVSLVAVVANLAAAPVVGPATVLGLGGGVRRPVLPGARPPGRRRRRRGARAGSSRSPSGAPRCRSPPSAGPHARSDWRCWCCSASGGRCVAGACAGAGRGTAIALGLPHGGRAARAAADSGMAAEGLGDGGLRRRPGRRARPQRRAAPRRRGRHRTRPDADGRLPATAGRPQIPLLVLTHFHADHVDGLAGAMLGPVASGRIEVTDLEDPVGGGRSWCGRSLLARHLDGPPGGVRRDRRAWGRCAGRCWRPSRPALTRVGLTAQRRQHRAARARRAVSASC